MSNSIVEKNDYKKMISNFVIDCSKSISISITLTYIKTIFSKFLYGEKEYTISRYFCDNVKTNNAKDLGIKYAIDLRSGVVLGIIGYLIKFL